jgi:hypothetical protein
MTVTANNDTFARMLVIELKYMGIDAKISDSVSPDDRFAIVDLDFTENIPSSVVALTYSKVNKSCDLLRPFSMKSFRSLIRSRFLQGEPGEKTLTVNSLGIFFGEHRINLTPKEKELFLLLYENRNRAVSEQTILEKIFPDSHGNVCTVYVGYLRQKIDARFEKKHIFTVRGGGYMIKI